MDSTLVEQDEMTEVMTDDEIPDHHQGDEAGLEIETRGDEIGTDPAVQVTKR